MRAALVALLAAPWMSGPPQPAHAQVAPPAPQQADQAFASYAFAPELGSGIYEIDGRALQIYRLPLAVERDGWRLTVPVTIGFYDFRTNDVIALRLPDGIGSVSITPGFETDLDPRANFRVTTFAKAGYTHSSGKAPDAVTFGFGLRSVLMRRGASVGDFDKQPKRSLEYRFYNEARLALADLRGPLPGDEFLRLRSAFQLDWGTKARLWHRPLRVAPYAMFDYYVDAPTAPVTGVSADPLQQEVGISFQLEPRPRWLGIGLPSLGMGYRFAGTLSGWRLAFGLPF